jgi:hypothetical protein
MCKFTFFTSLILKCGIGNAKAVTCMCICVCVCVYFCQNNRTSCYLRTISGHTDRPTDIGVQQFFYSCLYSLPQECLYLAVAWQRKEGFTSPNFCLATIGGIHVQTQRLMGGIYEVRRWDILRCSNIHTKFHENCFRHSKVNRGNSQIHRQHGDRINLN